MRARVCGAVVAAGLAALCGAATVSPAAAPAATHAAPAAKPKKNLPPKKPVLRGPRATRDRTPTWKFFSSDPDGKTTALRVWCGVDSVKLHRCGWNWTSKRLKPGKHALRVRVVDGRGAASPSTLVRVAIG